MLGKLLLLFACATSYVSVHGRPALQDTDWLAVGQDELKRALQLQQITNVAKNVVVFVGDGMGPSTVTAARVYQRQHDKPDPRLAFEKFPYVALSKTYDVDRFVADSSATATAILTGQKAPHGTVGVNEKAISKNCSSAKGNELTSILHWSQAEGKAVGVVSTARITHATPASAYASSASRYWEYRVDDPVGDCKDMAYQLVMNNSNIQVVMGGGRAYLTPNTTEDVEYAGKYGKRRDNLDLIAQWRKDKADRKLRYEYVWNKSEFDSVNPDNTDYLLGLFEPSHMQYEEDRTKDKEPSLSDLTEKAIRILKKNNKGFFLLVEGGRIDHAHHDSNARRAITETIAMSEAVARAESLLDDKDSLIVVTADHSHTFTIGGYPTWKAPVLGLNDDDYKPVGMDKMPFTILAYANGPGYSINKTTGLRQNLTNVDTEGLDYKQHSGVPLSKETHGGEEVAIFARGPMAHLFHGSHEQNYIAHLMAYASCVGPNKSLCMNSAAMAQSPSHVYLFFLVISICCYLKDFTF